MVAFIMLNPSTADENVLDPTLRRCMGFAGQWGYGGMEIVNLFAYRATDPSKLRQVNDPVGDENDLTIRLAEDRNEIMVAGWGVHGTYQGRDQAVLENRRYPDKWHCLGLTKDGHPRHPLYLAKSLTPERWLP